jgi:hypothetical protein
LQSSLPTAGCNCPTFVTTPLIHVCSLRLQNERCEKSPLLRRICIFTVVDAFGWLQLHSCCNDSAYPMLQPVAANMNVAKSHRLMQVFFIAVVVAYGKLKLPTFCNDSAYPVLQPAAAK